MNRIGVPESEHKELLAYLKNTYKYENGGIVNRKTGRRRRGGRTSSGYLKFHFSFKGKNCNNELPTTTIDHINGDKHDNRIENLREVIQSENNLNSLLPWRPNKDINVAGVFPHLGKFETKIQGHQYSFCNPYQAFYWAIACGKRYRAS